MKDFKGFDDWIAIFKGGKQIDSQGREHDGNEIIDKAIKTFDLTIHEPPLVVGHPKDNAPAFGWVTGLKKTGDILYAKFKDVAVELEGLVKRGFYKKRSASFYPDGRLRHVGLLGGTVPAVKALAEINFKEGKEDSMTFDFDEYTDAGGKIESLMQKKMAEDKTLAYNAAFAEVQRENPELAAEYAEVIRPTNNMSIKFNEQVNLGEQLNRKISEVLKNPPKVDRYGRKYEQFTYVDAVKLVGEENPELLRSYIESIR